jgi:hypothetical protein
MLLNHYVDRPVGIDPATDSVLVLLSMPCCMPNMLPGVCPISGGVPARLSKTASGGGGGI